MRRVGPSELRLETFGADEQVDIVPDLERHLEHAHEARIHAENVDLSCRWHSSQSSSASASSGIESESDGVVVAQQEVLRGSAAVP